MTTTEYTFGLVKPSEPTMGAKTWMLVYADSNAREALNARPAKKGSEQAKKGAELFIKSF